MKKLMLMMVLALGACLGEEEPPIDAAQFGYDPAPLPIDSNDACSACGVDQLCVQFFDGVCGELRVECQDRAAACTGTDCNACDLPHCRQDPNGPITFTCQAAGCPGELQGALHCYGP